MIFILITRFCEFWSLSGNFKQTPETFNLFRYDVQSIQRIIFEQDSWGAVQLYECVLSFLYGAVGIDPAGVEGGARVPAHLVHAGQPARTVAVNTALRLRLRN